MMKRISAFLASFLLILGSVFFFVQCKGNIPELNQGSLSTTGRAYQRIKILKDDDLALLYNEKKENNESSNYSRQSFISYKSKVIGPFDYLSLVNQPFYSDTGNQYDMISENVVLSADENSIAFIANENKKTYLYTASEKLVPFDECIVRGYLSDNKTLVYESKNNEKEITVHIGEKKYGPYDVVKNLTLIGNDVSFVFQKKTTNMEPKPALGIQKAVQYLLRGGQVIGPFDVIEIETSPDMKNTVYIIKENSELFVLENSGQYGPFDEINNISFAQDSRKFSIGARIGAEWFIITSNNKYGPYQEISCGNNPEEISIFHAKDRLAYQAKIDNKWYWLVDGEKIGPFTSLGDIVFSPDGEHFIYSALNENPLSANGWYLYSNNEKTGPFDFVKPLKFSSDGSILAYAVKTTSKSGTKWSVIAGKEKSPPFDDILDCTFSPHMNELAYAVRNKSSSYIYIGSRKVGPFEGLIDNLIFSPDGKTLAYNVYTGVGTFSLITDKTGTFIGSISGTKKAYIRNEEIISE